MNFSTFWPGSHRPNKKKRLKPKSKIPSALLGIPSKEGESSEHSMEEIRRQAVSMSSSGLGPSTVSVESQLVQTKKKSSKISASMT